MKPYPIAGKNESAFISNLSLVDEDLTLVFIEKVLVSPPDTDIFAYRFTMNHTASGQAMGGINIKAGYTENIRMYRGNIGFTVSEVHRGHHYSARSCQLLIPVLQWLGLDPIYLTCNVDNFASKKNIERLGAGFIEEVIIPKTSPYFSYYPEGSRRKLRFKWKVM